MTHLKKEDFNVIIESLVHSKKAYEEYQFYPSEDFRKQQITRVDEVMKKIKKELKDLKD